ncbi:hypothetical protein BX666DRAFT_1860649, partial [Dichotomocladium elegans]
DCSVGSHIKNKALELHSSFKSSDTNKQTIISLGLNSILSLTLNYPEGQSTLFDPAQWRDLKRKFPRRKYETSQYDHIKYKLHLLLSCHKVGNSWNKNWYKLYRITKALQKEYDAEENGECEEEDFCLFFIESILKLQKHHAYLFDDNVDKSKWDYICKLWSPIMEKLFAGSSLRLKWGDTKLSLADIEATNDLKPDLRILQDEIVQRYNRETDIAAFEVSKEDPGVQKFQSDHCKLMLECKTIIDMYISKGFDVDNVDCIQICGLDIIISNLCLSAPGLYIGNELFYGSIKGWVRGTWIAYRDSKSKLPPAPPNLVA